MRKKKLLKIVKTIKLPASLIMAKSISTSQLPPNANSRSGNIAPVHQSNLNNIPSAHLRGLGHLGQTVGYGRRHAARRRLVEHEALGPASVLGSQHPRQRVELRRVGRPASVPLGDARGLPVRLLLLLLLVLLDRAGEARGAAHPGHVATPHGPPALLEPLEVELPEAALARLVLRARQLHEALVQGEVVPDRVLELLLPRGVFFFYLSFVQCCWLFALLSGTGYCQAVCK